LSVEPIADYEKTILQFAQAVDVSDASVYKIQSFFYIGKLCTLFSQVETYVFIVLKLCCGGIRKMMRLKSRRSISKVHIL